MSKFVWGLVVWGFWLALLFPLLEIPAAANKTPWPTLSWTAWQLQKRIPALSIVILAGLAVLLSHIVNFKNIREGDE